MHAFFVVDVQNPQPNIVGPVVDKVKQTFNHCRIFQKDAYSMVCPYKSRNGKGLDHPVQLHSTMRDCVVCLINLIVLSDFSISESPVQRPCTMIWAAPCKNVSWSICGQ